MAQSNRIFQWEGDTTQPYEGAFTWKSKRFLFPYRTTFAVARVIAEVGDRSAFFATLEARRLTIIRNNARISNGLLGGAIGEGYVGDGLYALGSDLQEEVGAEPTYSGDYDLLVNFYADGVLKFTKNVYASDVPFRLADGFRARSFEVEIVGNVTVRRFDMASSMRELMQSPVQQPEGG